jgi:hypothetical protein
MLRLTVAAALLMLMPLTAGADDCVVASMAPSEVRQRIDDAPTCALALKIFQGCGWGSMADVVTAGHVISKCEAVFEDKLSRAHKRSYDRAQKACDRKYARETGSEGRSLTAFCYAEASARVEKQFSQAKAPAKK